MKKLVLGTVILTAPLGTVLAAELLSNDLITTTFKADLQVRSDDNILLTNAGKIDDVIYEIDPAVQFDLKGSLPTQISVTEAITRYSDTSALDTELLSLSLYSTMKTAKTTGSFSAGFREINQNAPGITAANPTILQRRDSTNFGAQFEHQASDLSSVGLGANYSRTDYKSATSINSKIFEVPFNYYYKKSPRLDLSAGFTYRETDLKSTPGYTDYYYNVGARMALSPDGKLSGNFSIGLSQRDYESSAASDESSLGLKANFNYKLTDKTTVNFGASNDFGAASGGQSQKILNLSGGAKTNFNDQWSASINVNYNHIRYVTTPARKDDYYDSVVAVNYILNSYCTLRASYTYRNNSSDALPLGSQDYKGNVIAISAALSY